MLPQEIQDLIKNLPVESQEVVKAIALIYESKVQKLEARIKELEDQISKNSKNSSKPPSSDGYFKPSPKSLRKKTNRKAGGQTGHKGQTLKLTTHPDTIILHKVEICSNCQKDLRATPLSDKIIRQVYDIPPLRMEVTEHRAEVKRCLCGCINKGIMPSDVSHYVQYGSNLKTLLCYLQDYQLLPYARAAELVDDLFEHKISQGTLHNIRKTAYGRLENFELDLESFLCKAPIAGFDETGLRVLSKLYWLHSCSTLDSVLYKVHPKRGSEAMNDIGILPNFKNIAVHDFWKSYYKYDCEHALCNAHILRELIFIKERFEQPWAEELIKLLLKMKQAKQRALLQNKVELSQATLKKYRKTYNEIIQKGLKDNPLIYPPPDEIKRGRVAKSKPRNLLERLRDFPEDILRFFYNFKVPFDNNFSERDLRMMKVKLKISGCFRSLTGAKAFARIRSFIATARKQGVNAFEAIQSLFTDNYVQRILISNLNAE